MQVVKFKNSNISFRIFYSERDDSTMNPFGGFFWIDFKENGIAFYSLYIDINGTTTYIGDLVKGKRKLYKDIAKRSTSILLNYCYDNNIGSELWTGFIGKYVSFFK